MANRNFYVFFFAVAGNSPESPSLSIIHLPNISNGVMDSRESPPKAIVDATPLQAAMDKNKECKC